jgi:glutamine amidotransferase
MCRLFAIRADRPVAVEEFLLAAPHSLCKQSCCDMREESHRDGWGVGYYENGTARRVRSPRPASDDPQYAELARSLRVRTAMAHVRQASMGEPNERNNHPFRCGNWLFAHNGTLHGFPSRREEILRSISDRLRTQIGGVTDSEHAFFYFLSRLEAAGGAVDGRAEPALMARVLAEVVRSLHGLCPGAGDERSEFNFVTTDGHTLVASRWGHSLCWLERKHPANGQAAQRAVIIASEPTSAEAWEEIPEHSVVVVQPDLKRRVMPIEQARD